MEYNQEMNEINRTLANELLGKKDDALAIDKARNAGEAARLKLNITQSLILTKKQRRRLKLKQRKKMLQTKRLLPTQKGLPTLTKKITDERARQVDQAMTLQKRICLRA